MENLVEGVMLTIKLTSDGTIKFGVYSEDAFQKLPDSKSVIGGETSDTLEMTSRIPADDDYYLVVDNRENKETRKVLVELIASLGNNSHEPGSRSTKSTSAASTHESFEQIKKAIVGTFDTDQLEILITRCGRANAFATSTQVLVCVEYVDQLREELNGDNDTYSKLMLFTIMHEMGHILLNAWELPGQHNEELTDEFAMVLMIMFNQAQGMNLVADYFANKSASTADSPIYPAGNHHPSYELRAENIRRWLDDPEFARNWQQLIVPHIRTAVLKDLLARPRSWSHDESIRAELLARQKNLSQKSTDT